MNWLKPSLALMVAGVVIGAIGHQLTSGRNHFAARQPYLLATEQNEASAVPSIASAESLPASRYRLDARESKFIAHALAGGLLWFKGHDHLVQVREFTGEARLDPDSIAASSLELDAKTASMEETSSVFTDAQKKIINKELHDIVLLPDQYPDITFKSTSVTGKSAGANEYDLRIVGNLTLHGVTRPITIPTKVTVTGNKLNAQGEFDINRSDFRVKATSAMHGLIRVRDRVKFTFDIVGHQSQ